MTKDYRVTVKVRNNRILKAIERSGGEPGQKWCEAHGLGYATVNSLINMTGSPVNDDGSMRPTAQRLCDVLNVIPDDLWSAEQLYPLEKNFSSFDMDYTEVSALISGGEQSYLPDFHGLEQEEIATMIDQCCLELTPNEETVIRMRFGLGGEDELSLEQVAQHLGVTRERIRQIEGKALRKLRHPKRSGLLLDALNDGQRSRVLERRGLCAG